MIWPHFSKVPIVFGYKLSDGFNKAALMAVESRQGEDLRLILSPERSGWNLRAWFGKKKFIVAVTACLLSLNGLKLGDDLQGGGVLAPLIPPQPTLIAAEAKELPKS